MSSQVSGLMLRGRSIRRLETISKTMVTLIWVQKMSFSWGILSQLLLKPWLLNKKKFAPSVKLRGKRSMAIPTAQITALSASTFTKRKETRTQTEKLWYISEVVEQFSWKPSTTRHRDARWHSRMMWLCSTLTIWMHLKLKLPKELWTAMPLLSMFTTISKSLASTKIASQSTGRVLEATWPVVCRWSLPRRKNPTWSKRSSWTCQWSMPAGYETLKQWTKSSKTGKTNTSQGWNSCAQTMKPNLQAKIHLYSLQKWIKSCWNWSQILWLWQESSTFIEQTLNIMRKDCSKMGNCWRNTSNQGQLTTLKTTSWKRTNRNF